MRVRKVYLMIRWFVSNPPCFLLRCFFLLPKLFQGCLKVRTPFAQVLPWLAPSLVLSSTFLCKFGMPPSGFAPTWDKKSWKHQQLRSFATCLRKLQGFQTQIFQNLWWFFLAKSMEISRERCGGLNPGFYIAQAESHFILGLFQGSKQEPSIQRGWMGIANLMHLVVKILFVILS